MRSFYSWNPVFNFVMNIKDKFIEKFGEIFYNEVTLDGKNISCLEYWIFKLNDDDINKLFGLLQVNQFNSMLLIRYRRYSDIYNGESEVTPDEIWDIYDGFYRECRSLVIEVEKEEIVLSPFKKFRNMNEGIENSLDNIIKRINCAKSIEITNKLDGSMQSARYYNGSIIMSGSQALDVNKSWRLQDGYKMIYSNDNYVKMLSENPNYTFIFEYISIADAHVVNYDKSQEGLYLIGIRDVFSGEQLSYKLVQKYAILYQIKVTQIFKKTFAEVLEDVKKYKSNQLEGFVINIDGFMFKIKCDDYVQIHRILSNISSINLIIRSIADNSFDDLISKVPESYRWRIHRISKLIFDYIKKTDLETKKYFEISPKDIRKSFMIFVDSNVPKEYSGYVKNLYFGKENNYLKSRHKNPHYKTMKEMGYNEDYSALFISEEE